MGSSDEVRAQRRDTRGLVLEVIRSRGPISRTELAESTGLTAATMTGVVRRLLADGLVVETGRAESTGGKRKVLLEVDAGARLAIGIQLGFTATVIVVTNMWGAVVGRSRMPGIGGAQPDEYLDRLAENADGLIASLGLDRATVIGVGLAVPAALEHPGHADTAQAPEGVWASFPLGDGVAQRMDADVVIERDAIAAAVGERWSGAVGESDAFVLIHMDDTIGAGIVLRGRPVRGAHGRAGDLGHMSIDPNGPSCSCGARGCLSAIGGSAASLNRYRDAVGRKVGEQTLNLAAVAGEQEALDALQPAVSAFATAVATLVDLIDPDRVVLAGSGFGSAISLFITGIQSRLDERFGAPAGSRVRVEPSVSVRDAPAIGAAALVLDSTIG